MLYAYIGPWRYIHMIMENSLPIKGQEYVWKYVCDLGSNISTREEGGKCV